MGVVECGGVDYMSYYGDITVSRKGGSLKFANAKNYDEEFALKEKQKFLDGDRISTGKKSFMMIAGHSTGGKTQFLSVFPDSEFVMRIKGWNETVKGEARKGIGISELKFIKGTFYVNVGEIPLVIPMADVKNIDKQRELVFMLDILPGMTVILPGCRMEVKGAGRSKPYETYPSYGSLGMTELMITTGGMYEKNMEVDERASVLSGALLQVGMGMPQDFKYEESMMDYSARKMAEGKKKSEEAAKQMLSEEDLQKMEKSGKVNKAQAEMARAMSKAMKSAGNASSPAFGLNMLASMDFSKLKDMPGLTTEQKKQLEDAAPQMAEAQKKLAGGKLAQMAAQANLSEKYLETMRNDPVAKKGMAKAKADYKERYDSFFLPPYPTPDEKFRVK